jgi:formate dehydrogenase maturation protein FdhE
VRIEECRAYQIYIKAVDLREVRRAAAVVDEFASVELDLWAGEQGLTKLQRNLLGL